MARKARKLDQSTTLSILHRSEALLFRNDEDREKMLEIMKQTQAKFGFVCFAYCLLDDHRFKLILDTQGRSISSIMSSILVAYSAYRQAEGKLFKGRFISKSLHQEAELQAEIDLIQKKSNSPYNSYCFHDKDAKKPAQLYVNLDPSGIPFGEIEAALSLEEAQAKLNAWMKAKGCDRLKLNKDKALRNQCIAEFRKSTNVSLKTIGLLFDLSESSVSKILK